MQAAVPDLADLSKEPTDIYERYGPESKKPGTYAANCILARRLAERGVRFIQLYHRGWDQHNNLPSGIKSQCHDTDQPTAALLAELKERGMLDDTLVIWGGEFGRTVYSQGVLTRDNHGRDHHPRCYSVWMAGAGVKGGHIHGETDDFSYNIVKDPVHIHDLNATALHLLGLDHTRLTLPLPRTRLSAYGYSWQRDPRSAVLNKASAYSKDSSWSSIPSPTLLATKGSTHALRRLSPTCAPWMARSNSDDTI
jgi:hypothetical protein